MTTSRLHETKEDIASEQAFHDAYYRKAREKGFDSDTSDWDTRALHPSSRPLDYWEYGFYLLGDIRGKRILDLGCGGGWISRLLALKGAAVVGMDISTEGCRLTRDRLEAYGLGADVAVMDAHAIAFKSDTFDGAFVNGVLHHMNLEKVAQELHRILRPGAKVVCYEPLKYGRIMWAIRQVWMRVNGLKEFDTTEHEEALRVRDFDAFASVFPKMQIRTFNFVAKTNRLRNRFGPFALTLRWVDYVLLSAFPFFRRYCTCILCYLQK